jgi:two-component system alkaline phosphatase synthesis response regulator PhoP
MIYCVEDDAGIRNMMVYTLKASGFDAIGCPDGQTFFELALKADQSPELVMLDIMLPGEDGMNILRRMRLNPFFKDVPVIMASAKGTEFDKVSGLDAGADDYLAKPFGMMEMISRVKAVLRRTSDKKQDHILSLGGLTLDSVKYKVTADGEELDLTLKEYELLHLFMKEPGRVFTRESMLAAVWDTDYVGESRTVDVHIGTLRNKLGKYGDAIKTVRGIGYRLDIEPYKNMSSKTEEGKEEDAPHDSTKTGEKNDSENI